jgi:4-hydroxy-2-oxoheptanedioate aldolase
MTEKPGLIRNHVKEKLARGETVASMIVRLVRTTEIARIAKTADFDSLYVDLEHNSFSLDTTGQICMAALDAGITPLVRVPSNTPDYISRVLDGGALGVIAPHVASAAEAKAVVDAAKYPPFGARSFGGPAPHLNYRSLSAVESNTAMNAATMVVAMLESKPGLEAIEEIVAVEGVDMILIGTNDLCAELGVTGEYDHPLIQAAYARTIAAASKHGKHVGVGGLAGRPDLAEKYVRQGARYVSTGADLSFLLQAATATAQAVHNIKL